LNIAMSPMWATLCIAAGSIAAIPWQAKIVAVADPARRMRR